MEVNKVPFNVSLPLLGVGAFTLVLSFCFCCYLWQLKRNTEVSERGYCTKKFIVKDKEQQFEKCPVCLEEFKSKEKIAVCPCKHSFHSSCLVQWLSQRNTCPLCKSPVRRSAGENTGLIPQLQQQQHQPQEQQQQHQQQQQQHQQQHHVVAGALLSS